MTQVAALVAPPKARTAVRSAMELDDQATAPRGVRAASLDAPDSPNSRSSPSLIRKRAASFISTGDSPRHSKMESLRINPPNNAANLDSLPDLCTCAPDPKIPRPPNAFILYRQAYQSQAQKEHPDMKVPDLSKVMGQRWKAESLATKSFWKARADEEKERHRAQYPGYKYQPSRRGSKAQANRSTTSPTSDGGCCTKCHRRFSAVTPATPFSTPTTGGMASEASHSPASRGDDLDYSHRGSYGSMPPNRSRYVSHHRPGFQDHDDLGLDSPELKRRRFGTVGAYYAAPSPNLGHAQVRSYHMGGSRHYDTPTLPEPGGLASRPKSTQMPPPPRPSIPGPWPEQGGPPGRYSSFDENLRLPPLQTSVPMSPGAAAEVDVRQIATPVTGLGISGPRDSQDRSVEAMVMSIPFPRKLAVLSRITQPLAPPRPGSPAIDTRGAIIAVEGPKSRMLLQVGHVVEKVLNESDEIAVKSWENHSIRDQQDMAAASREPSPAASKSFFESYLATMTRWHEKSREIIQYITGQGEKQSQMDIDEDKPRRGSAESTESEASQARSTGFKVPVALLKEGFSLTLSDRFACTVPITDSYAPVDHWQWMATLWRGVVGPDLVIYVKPSAEEEIAKLGTVDFQRRPGLMVVRIPIGNNLDQATERRVSFEVIEWMRGGSFREGFGQ